MLFLAGFTSASMMTRPPVIAITLNNALNIAKTHMGIGQKIWQPNSKLLQKYRFTSSFKDTETYWGKLDTTSWSLWLVLTNGSPLISLNGRPPNTQQFHECWRRLGRGCRRVEVELQHGPFQHRGIRMLRCWEPGGRVTRTTTGAGTRHALCLSAVWGGT